MWVLTACDEALYGCRANYFPVRDYLLALHGSLSQDIMMFSCTTFLYCTFDKSSLITPSAFKFSLQHILAFILIRYRETCMDVEINKSDDVESATKRVACVIENEEV
ncbi:hypothetical protein Plhal304r1_c042g0122031 [Plasmopara halstedii]